MEVAVPEQLLTETPSGCQADLVTKTGRLPMSCVFVTKGSLEITHESISISMENEILELRLLGIRNFKDDRFSDLFQVILKII